MNFVDAIGEWYTAQKSSKSYYDRTLRRLIELEFLARAVKEKDEPAIQSALDRLERMSGPRYGGFDFEIWTKSQEVVGGV